MDTHVNRPVTVLHALGFKYVTLDLDGFRSGSTERSGSARNSALPISARLPADDSDECDISGHPRHPRVGRRSLLPIPGTGYAW